MAEGFHKSVLARPKLSPLIGAILVSLLSNPVRADVEVRATIDRDQVTLDDQINLKVEITGSFRGGGEPVLPELEEWFVYSAGSSSNFSFVNGQVSASRVFNYVLVPQSEGTHTIGPIRIEVSGKSYATDPIVVRVSKGSGPTSPGSPGAGDPANESGSETKADRPRGVGDELFVTGSVDKDTVYVGEQVVWTFDFYRRVQILGNADYRPPSASNFWVEDLPPQRTFYRNRGGRQYHVTELKQAYFPTVPGVQTIGSARLGVTVDDFFNRDISDFFRRGYPGFGRQVELVTDPVELFVLPLPGRGRPEDFDGTVGRSFTLSVEAERTEGVVGDPITVTVKLRGKGNIKTVASPGLPQMPGLKVYESGSSSDLRKDGYQLAGVKAYEYVLIPQQPGETVVPSFRFSYFDTDKRKYVTLHSDPIALSVAPPEDGGDPSVVLVGGQEDIQVLGQDIRHIKTDFESSGDGGDVAYGSPVFWALQPLPLLALVTGLLYRRRQEKFASDVALARRTRSGKVARRHLTRARKAKEGDLEGFLSALAAALYGYLGDKLNLPRAGMTRDRIESSLRDQEVAAEHIDDLQGVLDELDLARFAPGGISMEARETLIDRVSRIIDSLEGAGRGWVPGWGRRS